MLLRFDEGTTAGLGGIGGAPDRPFVFRAGKLVLEEDAGLLEGGVEPP